MVGHAGRIVVVDIWFVYGVMWTAVEAELEATKKWPSPCKDYCRGGDMYNPIPSEGNCAAAIFGFMLFRT